MMNSQCQNFIPYGQLLMFMCDFLLIGTKNAALQTPILPDRQACENGYFRCTSSDLTSHHDY